MQLRVSLWTGQRVSGTNSLADGRKWRERNLRYRKRSGTALMSSSTNARAEARMVSVRSRQTDASSLIVSATIE